MIKIKEFRRKKGYSQTELANLLGITRQAINNYESGIREPNIDMLTKIAVVLNITVDELIDFKNKLEKIHEELNKRILEKDNAPKN